MRDAFKIKDHKTELNILHSVSFKDASNKLINLITFEHSKEFLFCTDIDELKNYFGENDIEINTHFRVFKKDGIKVDKWWNTRGISLNNNLNTKNITLHFKPDWEIKNFLRRSILFIFSSKKKGQIGNIEFDFDNSCRLIVKGCTQNLQSINVNIIKKLISINQFFIMENISLISIEDFSIEYLSNAYTKFPKEYHLKISETLVSIFYTIYLQYFCDGDVIDAGANIGLHSRLLGLLISGRFGKVIALEPNISLLEKINENCAIENLTNVEVINKGLFSETKENMKFIQSRKSVSKLAQLSYLDERLNLDFMKYDEKDFETKYIKTITLSELIKVYNLKPSFIKLDIEGCEYNVIKNDIDTINKFRPSISLEITPWNIPDNKHESFFDLISSINYSWFNFCGKKISKEFFCNHDWFSSWHWNSYLIPNEKSYIINQYIKICGPLILSHLKV